jgi:hypothetical protein
MRERDPVTKRFVKGGDAACSEVRKTNSEQSEAASTFQPEGAAAIGTPEQLKKWDKITRPRIIARVSAIPVNRRLVFAETKRGDRFEVIVGRNERLWVDCPIEIKVSDDYPGFYEVVGELPRGRWDRSYALRFDA